MDKSWFGTGRRYVQDRHLSPAAFRLKQVSSQGASLAARSADATTAAAQQCQLPPTPTCNTSKAFHVWDEVMEGMDLDRVLLLACKVLAQAGDSAVVRYPPADPSLAPKSAESISGVLVDEVWTSLPFAAP
jgi:hypothetical protein